MPLPNTRGAYFESLVLKRLKLLRKASRFEFLEEVLEGFLKLFKNLQQEWVKKELQKFDGLRSGDKQYCPTIPMNDKVRSF